MESLITFMKQVTVLLLVAYVVFISVLSVFQSKLVYMPFKDLVVTPEVLPLEYESIYFKADDGTRLHSWYIPKKDAKTTLLFLHGNAGNISHRLDSIEIFHNLNINVFIFDYRGYGNSDGKANEQNTYDDAKTAWDYLLKHKKIKPEDIIIFGRSIGGTIAAELATRVKAKGVILESTFTDIKELAGDMYPFIPKQLIKFNYGVTQHLKNINSPTLIIHSEDDEVVAFKYGQKIYEDAKEPKTFVRINGDHDHGFMESEEVYVPALEKFLKTLK